LLEEKQKQETKLVSRDCALAESEEGSAAVPGGDDIAPEYADIFKKKTPKKKYLFMAAGVLAAVGIGAGIWLLLSNRSSASSADTQYREYTVQRGDVTVGNSESSSISLNRETVTYPVSASVEEVYVKAGSSVKEGDPLVKFNTDDIQAGLQSYEIQLQNAELELEQAKLEEQTKLLQAKQDYDTAVNNGTLSGDTESLSMLQLQNNLTSAQTKYDAAAKKLSELETVRDDFESILYQIEKYQDEMDNAESQIASYKKLLEKLPTEDEVRNDDTLSSSEKEALLDKIDSLNDKIDDAQADYDDAKSEYDDYTAEYSEYYTLYSDTDALEDAITTAENDLSGAQATLLQAQLNYNSGSLTAEQKSASSELGSSVAATEYELTASELSQAVDEKQEAYDEMLSEINDVKESLNDDGIIYAPCTGMVADVSVEAGDSFEVVYDSNTGLTINQTILTLTDIGDVYVPITISEDDILNVYIGQPATVTMSAYEGRTFDAEVDTITVESSRSGAATVSYTVNVRFSDTNELEMYEGMSADITLIQKQVQDVLYVQASAVSFDNGVSTVYVKGDDGEPVLTEVKTGFSDGQYVEITSGLSEGDVVMVASGVAA